MTHASDLLATPAPALKPALGHMRHIGALENWACDDIGSRGEELREAAAFIAAQNAEIELLYDALRRVKNRVSAAKSAPQRDVWNIADRALRWLPP